MRILKIFIILLITIVYLNVLPQHAYSKEIVLFSFEKDPRDGRYLTGHYLRKTTLRNR